MCVCVSVWCVCPCGVCMCACVRASVRVCCEMHDECTFDVVCVLLEFFVTISSSFVIVFCMCTYV